MSSNWLTNFDLFLHTKGSDDVQLWRLKKTGSLSSSASMPIIRLTPDDFEYVSEVKDHQKLIKNMFQWNITDYNNLINYISTRRLLVNGEGMVIAELLKYDDDENELPVYFRSPDVLSLKNYIPSVQNRKKVKDVVVVAPMVDSNSTLQEKLYKERSDKQILAKRVADLEAENKTLETDVTKLKAVLATRTNEIAALETENKTLETDVTKLKAVLATRTNEIAALETANKTLETDVTKLKADMVTRTNEIADLESKNEALEGNVTKLTLELANAVTVSFGKEPWMKDDIVPNWAPIQHLTKPPALSNPFTVTQKRGTFTEIDNTTNVHSSYWFRMSFTNSPGWICTAIDVEDLIPNKDKARFLGGAGNWSAFLHEGKTYAFRSYKN